MGMSLVFRPQPCRDEGLQGFILRLAEGNHVTPQRRLWNDASPSPETLAGLLGVAAAPWAERLFRQHDNKGNRPLWNSRTRRYCPECLKDKPYWRQAWELSLMTACPKHGRSLIEACPKCDCVHTWPRGILLTCVCGHDLRRSESSSVDEKELRLAQALNHKVLGHDSEIPNLKLLDLGQLHTLIITLGVYAKPGVRPSLRDQKIDSLASAQELMRTAAEVLLNWPQGFYRMLDQVQQSMEADGSASLPGRFGRFYAYLYDHYKEPKYGFLLHAFEKYLEQNWRHPLAERNKRLSRPLRNKHIWVPVRTIAKELGAGVKQITSLVTNGEIESSQVRTTGGRTVLCINRQQTDLIRGLLKDRIDLKMAGEILGVKEHRVRQLLDHHLLGKVITPQENGSGRWHISRTSLEQILILGSDLPELELGEDLVGLGHAIRYWLAKPYLFPRLIIAVIQADLLPVAVDKTETGLCAWLYERQALQTWISDQIKGLRNGAMPIPAAAEYLKIKQEVAYHLVRTLILPVIVEKDSKTTLVELQALERFKESHVLGVELSRQLKVSPKKLYEMLAKENVFPVSGHWIDGGRQNIYRRSNALEGLMKGLAP